MLVLGVMSCRLRLLLQDAKGLEETSARILVTRLHLQLQALVTTSQRGDKTCTVFVKISVTVSGIR